LAGEPLLDPFAGEVVGHTDHEGAAVQAQRDGPVEPELEGGLVEATTEVFLRLVPDTCEFVVRRCPAGSSPGMRRPAGVSCDRRSEDAVEEAEALFAQRPFAVA